MEKFKEMLSEKGREFMVSLIAMGLMSISGIIMGISYFLLASIQTAFENTTCTFDVVNLYNWTTCQDIFSFAIYPFLNMKEVLIWANYFMIFGIVFGLFYMGFRARKHPVMLVVHIVSSIILGVISIYVGNIYRELLSIDVLYQILVPMGIYNKIMLYFPQFMWFVILISGALGFIGVFKSPNQFNEGAPELQ